jgi:hypothetical protein
MALSGHARRMFALLTASHMASASVASFFCRLKYGFTDDDENPNLGPQLRASAGIIRTRLLQQFLGRVRFIL